MKENQLSLLELEEPWKDEWQDMPEFIQEDASPHQQIIISFRTEEDVQDFSKLIDQPLTNRTKSAWYPTYDRERPSNFLYVNEKVKTRYPLYIISKGRWSNGTTRKVFDKMNVPYKMVVEPQEYNEYAKVIDKDKILTLPFSNLGQGSIPARNWVWEHSLSLEAKRHWIFDDNISCFYRLNNNRRLPVGDGTMFCVMEDFVDRYENVGIAGCQYMTFAQDSQLLPPYALNTRIYSMILIDNSLPFRWRGRYNEDTDLALRVLKSGLCTMLFNAFLGDKLATMLMGGGNTDNVYVDNDKRRKFAESLREQHPDVVSIVWRFERWHHQVNYKPFKNNKLIKKDGIIVPSGINNHGMELKRAQG